MKADRCLKDFSQCCEDKTTIIGCENKHNHLRKLGGGKRSCEINLISKKRSAFSHNMKADCESLGMRLNRAIATAGVCSRRNADKLVCGGAVKVNGQIELNPATRIDSRDIVEVSGRRLTFSPPLVYVILNKPIHTVCTVKDPQGRKTVMELIPEKLSKFRLYPVGRLDYFSEGLLLLTNDGALAHRLLHPAFEFPKFYEVLLRGIVSEDSATKMTRGMVLEDGTRARAVHAKLEYLDNGNTRMLLELRQGINRQIRRMCDQLNLVILRLKRTGEGSLRLKGLAPGKCRQLTKQEVGSLYKEIHLQPGK